MAGADFYLAVRENSNEIVSGRKAVILYAGASVTALEAETIAGSPSTLAATVRLERPAEDPLISRMEAYRNVGEVALFVRDPPGAAAAHPWESGTPILDTKYRRRWSGRLASVSYDLERSVLEIEGEGWILAASERVLIDQVYSEIRAYTLISTLVASSGLLDPDNGPWLGTDVDGAGTALDRRIFQVDLSGISLSEALSRVREIVGPAMRWGVDANRIFFAKYREDPILDTDTRVRTYELGGEASRYRLRTEATELATRVRVWGGVDEAAPGDTDLDRRFRALVISEAGEDLYGRREIQTIRDDITTTTLLSQIGQAVLHERNSPRVRGSVEVPSDDLWDVEASRGLRGVSVRDRDRIAIRYASAERPGTTHGLSTNFAFASSEYAVFQPPINSPGGSTPFFIRITARPITLANGLDFTMLAAGLSPGFPFVRLVMRQASSLTNVLLEYTSPPVGAIKTPINWPAGIDLSGFTREWIFSFNGTNTYSLYEDGVLRQTSLSTFEGPILSADLWWVAVNESVLEHFNGDIDQIEIYDGIAYDANVHGGGFRRRLPRNRASGLAAMVTFDDVPGTFWARDRLGSETQGVLVNTPTAAVSLVSPDGGARFGTPPTPDARWGDEGVLLGASPIVFPSRVSRTWEGESWRTEIDFETEAANPGETIAKLDADVKRITDTALR